MQLSALIDQFQSSGRYTFSAKEVEEEWRKTGSSVRQALNRLAQQRRVSKLRRGFYVIVPQEYRTAGSPPASWFIDDLMRHLGQDYYVGLLSAAALHGAAHQQPMVFQVITDRPTKTIKSGRVTVSFIMSSTTRSVRVKSIQTETGKMFVSSLETTVLDLVRFSSKSGGMSNVATLMGELSDQIDGGELARLSSFYPTTTVQRLGYLLDTIGAQRLTDQLSRSLYDRRYRPTKLVSGARVFDNECDDRWRIIPNVDIEPEL